jgi:type IV secretion system protein VirB9
MDPRRLLTLTGCALVLAGCANLNDALPGGAYRAELAAKGKPRKADPSTAPALSAASEPPRITAMAPIPNPPEPAPKAAPEPAAASASEAAFAAPVALAEPKPRSRPRSRAPRGPAAATTTGRAAIAQANAEARAASTADGFVGGVQMFGYEPGRIYEVWTAPYRVSTLTLAPGETVTSKAAGDTVRWQIGETTSGSGTAQRTHVLLKPLEAGLETNLVLTTSQRVYMLMLRSGSGEAFNAAVAWRYPDAPLVPAAEPAPSSVEARLEPERLDGRYKIEPRGRRPRWTPSAVFSDGARTFITLAPDAAIDEAPVLFVLAPDGEAQVVNYRQQDGVLVVDRVFDRAELRLGSKRPQIVRISRLSAGAKS